MAELETCLFCCLSLLAGVPQYMPERGHRFYQRFSRFAFATMLILKTVQDTSNYKETNLSPAISESLTGVRVIKQGLMAGDLSGILKTGSASRLSPFLLPIIAHVFTLTPQSLVNIHYDIERQQGMSQIVTPNVLYLKKKSRGGSVRGK